MKLLHKKHIIPIVFSLALTVWIEMFVSMEWTSAYCSYPEDGRVSALYGFPFPYVRWGMASSLEYIFIPYILVLNTFIVTLFLFPIVNIFLNRFMPIGTIRRVGWCDWYSFFSRMGSCIYHIGSR